MKLKPITGAEYTAAEKAINNGEKITAETLIKRAEAQKWKIFFNG